MSFEPASGAVSNKTVLESEVKGLVGFPSEA